MEYNLVWNHSRDFKIERARSASSIWNHKYDFRPKLHDPKFNYHFIKPILKTHNFMALHFRFWCIKCSKPSRFVRNSGTGNALTSWCAKRCHVTKTHSSVTNKQAVLKWERKQHLSCIKVRFSSPESMMENLPFSCGWGCSMALCTSLRDSSPLVSLFLFVTSA